MRELIRRNNLWPYLQYVGVAVVIALGTPVAVLALTLAAPNERPVPVDASSATGAHLQSGKPGPAEEGERGPGGSAEYQRGPIPAQDPSTTAEAPPTLGSSAPASAPATASASATASAPAAASPAPTAVGADPAPTTNSDATPAPFAATEPPPRGNVTDQGIADSATNTVVSPIPSPDAPDIR